MRKTVKIELLDLLDFIIAAEDYGYCQSIVMRSCADWLDHKLTDDEIDGLVTSLPDDYDEDDREGMRSILEEFRQRWIKS